MDLDAYVCEHAGQWRRLEHLTRKRRLAPPEVDELISLYQRTGTHLSVIRSRSPDPALVARLSRIVLAAPGALTGRVISLPAQNLFTVGLVGGVMIGNGRSAEFFGLIAPHGLLELTAVFVASGVGLRIGWAWIAPGPGRTRGRALAETARSGMLVALGLVGVLAVSGLIEAFVTPSPLPTAARVGIGVLAWLGFLAYVVVLGRRA